MHLMKNVGHKVILTQRTILLLWTFGTCYSSLDCAYTLFVISIPVLVFKASYIRGFLMYAGTVKYFVLFNRKKGSPTSSSNCLGHFHTSCPMGRGREGGWGGMLHKYLRFRVFGCLMLRYFLLQFLSNQFLLRRPICIVII